jgi:hypothetical protein
MKKSERKEKKVSNVKKVNSERKVFLKKKMSLEIPNRLTNMLKKVAQDAMRKAIRECSREYNFSEEEALIKLKIEDLRIREKGKKEKKEKKEKRKIPLPYNNEYSEECCHALRLNQGLYTQCENEKEEGKLYCKGCGKKTEDEMPEYGTIIMRRGTGIMGYVDPKGRKPTPYVKIMKKLNLTREQVIEEAERLKKSMYECHFEEVEQKRGRPAAAIKEKVAKGVKGRPKKTKKVVEIRGDTIDIFASLVANAEKEELPALSNESEEMDVLFAKLVSDVLEPKKTEEVVEEKVVEEVVVEEDKRKEKEEKRKEKEQREKEREEKRKEKEQREKEREEKRKEKEQREKEREEKRKEKEQREKEREEKRKEKEAGKKKTEVPVEVKKAEVPVEVKKAEVEEEEEEKFKKIIYNGTKYLVSRRTSIAYDYDKFANGEHVVVGKYNEKTKMIEKDDEEEEVSSDEESEDEYDE